MILALLVTFGCSKPAETAGGFDWPRWRGPDGNGQSEETEWDPASIANPRVLWTVNVGLGFSNVVIRDVRLYTTGITRDGLTISCLDAATGKTRWKQFLKSTFNPQTTPMLEGNDLYILTNEGSLHTLDLRTGKTKWHRDLVTEYGATRPCYGFAGAPVAEGDLLILNVNTAGMALKRATGELVWTSEAPPVVELLHKIGDDNGATYMTPVLCTLDGRRCALIYGWKGLSAVNPETGTAFWTCEWRNYNNCRVPDPVVLGDQILIADETTSDNFRSSTLLRVINGKPERVWESRDLFSDVGTPLIVDGYIYDSHGGPYSISPHPPTLRCLELETGRLVWEERLAGKRELWISLTAAAGKLLALTENGTLCIADASPDGFKELARCDVFQGANKPRQFFTPPVLCNAKIYCRSAGGDLVCIDVSK